jgi:hypothetical protein
MYQPLSAFHDAMPFGLHEGRVLPDLVLHEPQYFYWALQKGILRDVYDNEELDALIGRAASIRIPPSLQSGTIRVADYHWENNTPIQVRLREETEARSRHTRCRKTLDHLDIAFTLNYRKTRYHNAYNPVINKVYEEYFPEATEQINEVQATKFFTTRSNFMRGI